MSMFRLNIKKLPKIKIPVLLVIIFCLMLWSTNLVAALLITLFFVFLQYKWDNEIITSLAIILLLISFILIIFAKLKLAESVAIYAFYFLLLTTILQISQFYKQAKRTKQ